MSFDGPSTDPLQAFIRPILGLPAWGVKQGHGSFLTFAFGDPKLAISERQRRGKTRRTAYVQGQWHLWIYCCHWRICEEDAQLAWSEDAKDVIGAAAAALNGQKLLEIRIAPEDGRSRFVFDLGGVLETWPYGEDPTDEQWIILTATEAFVFRADGLYSHGPSDAPPDAACWMPRG